MHTSAFSVKLKKFTLNLEAITKNLKAISLKLLCLALFLNIKYKYSEFLLKKTPLMMSKNLIT